MDLTIRGPGHTMLKADLEEKRDELNKILSLLENIEREIECSYNDLEMTVYEQQRPGPNRKKVKIKGTVKSVNNAPRVNDLFDLTDWDTFKLSPADKEVEERYILLAVKVLGDV